jgi:dynein heavy chain
MLDESLASVNTILGSRFVKPLRTEAEGWKKTLMYLSKVLDNWIFLQRQWIYLENIFSSGDIKKQLSAEAQKFEQVDRFFKILTTKTQRSPNVLRVMKQNNNLNENLSANNETLDDI